MNALHVKQYNKYYEDLLAAALGTEGEKCRTKDAEKNFIGLVSNQMIILKFIILKLRGDKFIYRSLSYPDQNLTS